LRAARPAAARGARALAARDRHRPLAGSVDMVDRVGARARRAAGPCAGNAFRRRIVRLHSRA
jgi:hypothetical protein